MSVILGTSGQGKQLARTTPIQVTGLKALGQDGGVLLTCDPPTEASYPYLQDYWVVWKKKSEGPIQHPYDGKHMTFAAGQPVSGQDLAKLAAGSTLKIVENTVMVPFLVLKAGYPTVDDSNTLLIRKDIYITSAWGSNNAYAGSTVDNFLTNDYLLLINESVRNQIVEVNIPYTIGNGNNTVSTLSRKIFLLSATELGYTGSYANTEGSMIPYLESDANKLAYFEGSLANWWLRSPGTSGTVSSWYVQTTGALNRSDVSSPYGIRPAFCLPSTVQVSLEPDSDGDYTLV